MSIDRRMVGALPVAAIAGALGATFLLGGPSPSVTAQDSARVTQEQRATATSLEGAFINIADKARPATVYIESRVEASVRPGRFRQEDEFPFGEMFPFRGMPRGGPRSGRAQGSGVIVRADGYILTNDHVVAGAQNGVVTVTMQDGSQYRGKVTRDQRSDLALVKIDAGKPLPYVEMADSGDVRVGQWAVAIGSPFGAEGQGSMTAGIISAKGRKPTIGGGTEARYYPNLIQTDAAINPGNSGGPLLNIDGRLIGINVAIESPTGANAGIGFAIPSNTAKSVMEQLIANGKVVRGYLGLLPSDIPAGLRGRLGTDKGAYVVQVSGGAPAQEAGIKPNDVITEFAGKPVTDEVVLRDAISASTPGTRASVTVLRNGETKTLDVTIGSVPEVQTASAAPAETRPSGKLGIAPAPLSAEQAQELKLDAGVRGVLVRAVEPGSAAAEAGLAPRVVITAVNGQPVASPEALNRAVAAAKSGDLVTLMVLRVDDGDEKPSEAVINITVP